MPRKSKDELQELENEVKSNTVRTKNKVSPKTGNNSKMKSNVSESKTSKKEVNTKKGNKTQVTKTVSNNTTKTASANAKTNANTLNSNTSTKATNTRKPASKKKTATTQVASKKMVSSVEYYDLPYRYNETTVKILAQTPTMLFIYWDISDKDRASYIEKYGKDFFNTTKPVLIVTNKTMNYTFEVEINDFANSWYLHVNDADCDYSIELGRRPVYPSSGIDNYIHISTSNDMEMPNNHILFDKLGKSIFFKNVKNNFVEEKDISSISFIKNLGKVYHIYELYKEMYKDEINIEELNNEDIKLNLSSSSSSTFR